MNEVKIYSITVHGCDDSTTVYRKIDNPEELKLITELAQQITETSHYSCMPTMKIEELTNSDEKRFDTILTVFGYNEDIINFLDSNSKELRLVENIHNEEIQSALNNKLLLEFVLGLEIAPVENVFSSDYILRKKEEII